MLVLEEAAFMSDEMHAAVLPMLATTNGPLWMLSTSNAKSGFFYETWQHGGPEWHRVRVLATECSRISPEFLDTQVAELGMERFRREFFCEFTGDGADAFDRDLVEAALDDSVEPMALLGDDARLTAQQVSRLWLTERADQAFIVAVDLGKKTDYSTIVVLEQCGDELHVRGAERAKLGTPYCEVVEMVREVVTSPRLRGRCSLVVDGSGVGEPVVELLRRGDFGCKVTSVMITGGRTARAGRRPGTRNVPKFDLMAGLQVSIESGELKIAKRMKEAGTLVRELLDVRVKPNGSMSAEGVGKHDDLVMATALAVWKARRGRNDWGSGGFC